MNPLLPSFMNVSAKAVAGTDAVAPQQSTNGSEFKSALDQASTNKVRIPVESAERTVDPGGSPQVVSAASGLTGAEKQTTTDVSVNTSAEVSAETVETLTTEFLPTTASEPMPVLTSPISEMDTQVLVATTQSGGETAAGATSSGLTTSVLPTDELQAVLANANSALANSANDSASSATHLAMGLEQSASQLARLEANTPQSLSKGLGGAIQNSLQPQTLVTAAATDAEAGTSKLSTSGLLQPETLNTNAGKLNMTQPGKEANPEVLQPSGVKNLASVLTGEAAEGEIAGLKAENKMPVSLVQTASVSELVRRFNLNSNKQNGTINFEQLLQGSRESMQLSQFMHEKTSTETSGLATHTAFSTTQLTDSARATMQMPVNITFGRPEWAGQVAERAALMSFQKIQVAELQLDPPDLGSLHVKVTVNADQQAAVTFVSPHAHVRDALDQSVVRLRELLEQQGLDLVDVNVSDQQQHADDHEEELYDSDNEQADIVDNAPIEEKATATVELMSHYGVDFYA